MLDNDLPTMLPGMDELLADMKLVVKKHKLDEIDIDTSGVFNFSASGSDEQASSEKGEDEEPETGLLAHTKKVAEAIGEGEQRWKIINDLWIVHKRSPLTINSMTGTVQQQEAVGSKVRLRVKVVPMNLAQQDPDVMMNVIVPPVFVQMVKKDGRWLYDGVDRVATRKAAKKFMANQREAMRSAPRDDF